MRFYVLNYANCLIEDLILLILWEIIDSEKWNWRKCIITYTFLGLWSIAITLMDSVIFTLLPVNFLMVFSCMWVGFRRSFKDTLFRTIFVYLLLLFFQCIILCLIPASWIGTQAGNFTVNGTVLLLSILSLFIGEKVHLSDIYHTHMRTFWAFLLALCIPEILLAQIGILQYGTKSTLIMALLVSLQTLYMTVVLLMFSNLTRKAKTQQLINTQKYIGEMNGHLEETRRSVHDFNKHIRYLRNAVANRSNDTELIKDINNYCKRMLAIYEEAEILLHLDDPVLRAILYGRRTQAHINHIQFHLEATPVLPALPLESYQVVEIMDNLIDNAFECVTQLPENERWIKITLNSRPKPENRTQHAIFIENPCNELDPLSILSGNHTTTKGGKHQGIGLKHVSNTIKNSGGQFMVNVQDDVFSAQIEYIT